MNQIIIRKAVVEDITGVLDLQNQFLLRNAKEKGIEKRGFLVYPVTSKELEKIISNNLNILVVAIYEEKIVGYGLAYDWKEWKKIKKEMSIKASDSVKKHLSKDKILYFRHIARKIEFPGVGELIENKVYDIGKKKGYNAVVGEILEKPILNEKSKEVHEKRGFKKIGQVDYKDKNLWGLYEKELE